MFWKKASPTPTTSGGAPIAPRTPARREAPAPDAPEAIAINLEELAALERALLEADRLRRQWMGSAPHYGDRLFSVHDVTALLYQRAGAASVVQPDPQRARLPLHRHEIKWLTDAIKSMERHFGNSRDLSDARRLHNRFNALLGQARAITHMGGMPVFTHESEQVPEAHLIPPRES
ncbi:hypothetical protein [Streptomyces sp. NPDC007369]|uniref:hypothetical protein n=1 Tax=Streptomyces sp. NPDC007369 TaxID=3154589 RepID=UPI0033BFE132